MLTCGFCLASQAVLAAPSLVTELPSGNAAIRLRISSSTSSVSIVTSLLCASLRAAPGTVLAAFNNETYDVALDAAQKGADGMMCAVGRARLRIVSADGAVPPLYLPANAAPMGLTSVATES